MKILSKQLAAGVLLAGVACSAGAWGPKAQVSVVTTACHLLSRSLNVDLNRYAAEIQQGALISAEALEALYPSLRTNPVFSVESEMFLLQRVREARLDPYYAWRLGTLGKLVAETTSPLTTAPATYRNLYFADVEGQIEKVALSSSQRMTVDPEVYFRRRIDEANYNNDVIVKEYQGGAGFNGLARNLLEQDAGRSVASVADVWQTIFTGAAVSGVISDNQLQEYVLNGMAFYIRRGNTQEVTAAAERYRGLIKFNAGMHAAIGDLYSAQDFKEEAVREYKQALQLDPDLRDVTQKISQYLVAKGDEALQEERLEDARDAYAAAMDANPLHDSAEGDRLTVERLIRDRDERRAVNQEALNRAGEFQALAEQEALEQRISEAIALLHQAAATYEEVTDEFPVEREKREWGLNQVRNRIGDMKQELIANARQFSGSGYAFDAANLAKTRAKVVNEETMQRMVRNAFDAELAQLRDSLGQKLIPSVQ
ncbi:MAG: hypothetical protein HYV27_21750 [Candidatus Hydrogenedentes bacterium]|nr:hypothetical protein [Candidatus Hydrogenedentota bacterium]